MLINGVSEKDAGLFFCVKLIHLTECVRKFFFNRIKLRNIPT